MKGNPMEEAKTSAANIYAEDGCRFIPEAVLCIQNIRTRNCAECGWNPKVDNTRKEKIRKELNDNVR